MKRFYILVEVDVQDYGYNAENVYMFDDKEKAVAKMKELYLIAFKKYCNENDNPFATDNYSYEFGTDYAYVSGMYYLDIFNKDLEY